MKHNWNKIVSKVVAKLRCCVLSYKDSFQNQVYMLIKSYKNNKNVEKIISKCTYGPSRNDCRVATLSDLKLQEFIIKFKIKF